ncbi:mRNA 3' end processing factor [Tyrophagus putrescentiae]|nr:mRNA 3' end processing factor [Tyrophagus putrescentiae]
MATTASSKAEDPSEEAVAAENDHDDPDDPVAGFRHELDLLLINSKPMITMLTMLADDYKDSYAAEIADCIEERLFAVQSVEVKLPTLYLIDSICKNLGESSAYVALFQRKLVRIFTHTFERAKDDKTRLLLHKLRTTWNDVFHPEVLHLLDVAVHRLDPGWPVVAPNRNSNRSVLPPSSASTSTLPSHQVAHSQADSNGGLGGLCRLQSGRRADHRRLDARARLRNQQIELQLYNDLLLRTMNASATASTTSTSGNSPPEVVSSSTNNNSNRQQQQTTVSPRKGIDGNAGAASNAAKRGRNASPSDNGKKPRRRASSPDSHHQQQQSSNRPSGHQRSPGGKPSAAESPGNRRTSRDDRRAPISPRVRKSSSSASNAAEPLPPPPAPDSVIPLGSSHHVSVSKRVIKPMLGGGGGRNAEGSAIVAAIRSHRRASPPPLRNQRSTHSRSRSPPPQRNSSERGLQHRMTFNIPRRQPTPPPLLRTSKKEEEEEGGFGAMDVDYRTAFGLSAPMVKAEGDLPPAFQQQQQQPLATSPPATSLSPTVLMAPLAPQLQLPPETFQPTPYPPPPQPLQPSLPVATISAPVPLSTSSSTPVQALLTEPHGSVVLFINAELARLFYLDQVTAVVVKAHPDTPFDTLVSWAPSVYFAGPTTYVYVDEGTPSAQTLCLEFSRVPAPMTFFVGGAPHLQQTIQLGLPARELVLNGAAYTIAFGGEPINVFLGEAVGYHTFRLSDSRPHLQFSEEVRYDLWSRLVDESRVKAGLPPMGVAFPVMNSTVVAAPVVKLEAPQAQAPAAQPLEICFEADGGGADFESAAVCAGCRFSSNFNNSCRARVPIQPKTSFPPLPPLPPLPPVPTSHHPNGRRKTKRERRIDRQRYRAALHYYQQQRLKQSQLAAMQAQVARTAPQQAHSKPQPPKRYLPLEVASLKAVHAFPVEQLYSGTPCTNCSLRFGEEALRPEEGKKSSRYARHLDWHFRQNRRLKAKPSTSSSEGSSSNTSTRGGGRRGGHHSKTTTSASTSAATISTAAAAQRRAWYYPLDLWILYKEVNDDLEEEAAAAAAFFDANASASAAAGSSAASSAASGALLATLASFDWGRFRESIQPYEAFMEVVNGSHATTAGAEAEAVAAKCAKCTVVAESSSITEITCALCKEVLEQKWGEEEEEWRVENAVRFKEEKATEDKENPEESPEQEVVGKIYHPLCLKDHLVAKERAKQEQQQKEEEEAADDEEEDEDEELDEELDDLELDISLTAISEDQLNSTTTAAADNTKEEEEKMDVDETSATVLTSADDQQQETEGNETTEEQVIVKEEAMDEEAEEVPREIEVKVFEFEIPIAATSTSTTSSANTNTSTSTTAEQLLQLTKEEENTTAATSSSSSELLLEQSSVDTNCSDDQQLPQSETSPSSQPGAESDEHHHHQNSTGKLSTEPQLPLPPLKRGGLVINLAKTTTSASVSLLSAASTEHPAEGSLSLTSDSQSQSPPSPSSSSPKSPSCEVKVEADDSPTSKASGGPVEEGAPEEKEEKANYYSRGEEMSSLCSIM